MRFRDLRSLAFALTLAVVALAPAIARAQDYTDIWWNAGGTESGWGVNFVQNEDIIFATFYIYDVNKQPIWYSAAMTRTVSGTYVGPLYQTAGSFFGNAWNPADHPGAALVGSSTFTPSSATTGTLNYSITTGPNTGAASKQIGRFAFKTILLGGSYSGVMSETDSNCTNSANNGTFSARDIDPQVTQVNGQLQIIVAFTGTTDSCTLVGTVVQEGQLFSIPAATYTCTRGANTIASVYEIKATSLGIEGRWLAPNIGDGAGGSCRQDVNFSALLN